MQRERYRGRNDIDATGQCHRLVDTVPVFTTANITPSSAFPCDLWLRAESERVAGDTVLVRLLDGVTTVAGVDLISMDADAVRWR